MDMLALTSYAEGFPNVILEALCMGIPVVASDVGGVSDIVYEGKTGFLVDSGDVAAIVRGIGNYLSDPSLGVRHVQEGRSLVSKKFEFSTRVQIMENLYQRLYETRDIRAAV